MEESYASSSSEFSEKSRRHDYYSTLLVDLLNKRHICMIGHTECRYPLDFSWCLCPLKCKENPLNYFQREQVRKELIERNATKKWTESRQEYERRCWENPTEMFRHVRKIEEESAEYQEYYKKDREELRQAIEDSWVQYSQQRYSR